MSRAAAVSRDATPPVVNVSVPVDHLDQLFEAIEKADKHDDSVEQQDFFVQQNPATRKMGSLVSETYDAMIASMASEIAKVLK